MNHKKDFFAHIASFFNIGTRKQNLGLIADIRKSMGVFCKKVSALNDSYIEEKHLAIELNKNAEQMILSQDITAVKLEQDILMKITETSSACDAAISLGNGADFKKHLAVLDQLVKQRIRLS